MDRTTEVDGHLFLAIGPFSWGRGRTIEEAVCKMRDLTDKRIQEESVTIHCLPDGSEDDGREPFVNRHGTVVFTRHKEPAENSPLSRCEKCGRWVLSDL